MQKVLELVNGSSGAIAYPFIASNPEEATNVHPQIQYEHNVMELLTYMLFGRLIFVTSLIFRPLCVCLLLAMKLKS